MLTNEVKIELSVPNFQCSTILYETGAVHFVAKNLNISRSSEDFPSTDLTHFFPQVQSVFPRPRL